MNKGGSDMTIIGPTAKVSGDLHHDGPAQVLGGFEGKIYATGQVHIAQSAVCRGTIEAEQVIVDGDVEGDITARQRLQLTATARVVGDLVARTLIVEEGASFVGNCRVSSSSKQQHMVAQPHRGEPAVIEVSKVRLDDESPRMVRTHSSPHQSVGERRAVRIGE